MAEAHAASPYTIPPAVDQVTPQYVFPIDVEANAVPDESIAGHDGWWDNTGFAPSLRVSPTGSPDANRLRTLPLYETRAGEGDPDAFADRYSRERVRRGNAAENQDADGWEEVKEAPSYYMRPRPSDTGEPRPTTKMSPNTYAFTRKFPGLGTSGHLNGLHFSMADHRREYPILGMAPVMQRRNTYRVEPEPWDTDVVDVPPDYEPPDYRVKAVDVPVSGGPSQSWRLT